MYKSELYYLYEYCLSIELSFTIYKNFQDLHELQRKSSKKVYNRISYQLYTSYEWYIILTLLISKDIKIIYLS